MNTCLKGVDQFDPQAEDVVVILGQGPIGLIFTMLVKRTGATIVATDTMPSRRELAERFGPPRHSIRATRDCRNGSWQ